MVLNAEDYDAAYFGYIESDLKRKSGYSNYLELQTNYIAKRNYEKFIASHNFKAKDKILELGAAVGYFGKIARVNGLNVKCVDVSQWCYDNRMHPDFEKADAFEFLPGVQDKSFDYIISFGFLECFADTKLQALVILMNQVAKKQIHVIYKEGKSQWYNIKTISQWKSFFDDSAIIEKYFG